MLAGGIRRERDEEECPRRRRGALILAGKIRRVERAPSRNEKQASPSSLAGLNLESRRIHIANPRRSI